ncbi:PKD domain-containing protein [bacterium]|nr:PKD domain-containing protein [bacterium]
MPTLSAQHFWVRPYEGSADGAASNYVVVKLPPKTAPQAKLSTSGVPATPAQITWDASQSSDADGQIVRYEWDFDDDGEYEYDGGDIPTADFYYYEEGNYGAAVRVTDDDGLSDTASWAVIITTAATWHVERVDGANSPYTHILNLAGRPAIFYFPRYEEPGNPSQHIIRAEDEFGSSWEDPLPISAPLRENGFVLVEGHPATTALWFDVPTQMNSLRFWRASDDGGTAWPSPVVLLETAFSNDAFTLLIYDGKPAVLYDFPLRYMLAKDATGSAWNEPVETPKSRGALSVIDGRFAMAYDGVGLTFTRAVNYDATEWTDAVEIDQPAVSENIKLIEAGGVPGIAYYDDTLQVMKYVPAVDAAGSAWREPVIIVNGRYTRYTLEIVDGRPVIVYYDYSGKTVHFVSSNNAQGSSWGRPALVATEVELPFIGQSPSVTDLNGRPAICFLEKDKVDPNLFQDRQLTYASMY